MRRIVFAGMCALGLAMAPAFADDAVERTYVLDVVLGADGSVQSTEVRDEAPASVAAFLDQRVRQWRFQPGEVDGTPAQTHTAVSVRLRATPRADNPDQMDVAVLGAATGAASESSAPPRYPRNAARRGGEGTVVVAVDIDGDGKVIDARPFEHAPRVDRSLQRAVLDSMDEWTFRPERVAGQGVPATVVVPVCFTMHRMPASGEMPDVETPRCEYSLSGDPDDAPETLSVTLEPAARLLSDPTREPVAD